MPLQRELQAASRSEWRTLIKAKVCDFEIEHRSELESKRDELKARSSTVIIYNFENVPTHMAVVRKDLHTKDWLHKPPLNIKF